MNHVKGGVRQLRRNLRAYTLCCGNITAEHDHRTPCPGKLAARDLADAVGGARYHRYAVHASRRKSVAR